MNWLMWLLVGLFVLSTITNAIQASKPTRVRVTTQGTYVLAALMDMALAFGLLISGGVI